MGGERRGGGGVKGKEESGEGRSEGRGGGWGLGMGGWVRMCRDMKRGGWWCGWGYGGALIGWWCGGGMGSWAWVWVWVWGGERGGISGGSRENGESVFVCRSQS